MIPAIAAALLITLMWAYLFTARARLTDASEFDLIDTRGTPERWPSVSVIIPARNEAEMLRFTLPSPLSFYYPQFEVILVDDCSEDGTAEVARQVGAARERENLRIVAGTPPPPGWRGKLWALEQGLRAGNGEWLLLLDADISCKPNLLRDLVRFALSQGYQMVSLMALLRAETLWDRLLIPSFFFFFHVLYPFHRVRSPRSATAAAAGGCVLIERAALLRAGGLEAVRGAWIDDVALAGAIKRSGAKIYLGATVQAASFRRYGSLKSIREMVTRSAFTQLRQSWALVAVTLLALAVLFGAPVVGALVVSIAGTALGPLDLVCLMGAACGFSLSFMIAAYAPALRLYQLPVVWALTLPVAAFLYGAMTVESAVRHTFGEGSFWKGRTSKQSA